MNHTPLIIASHAKLQSVTRHRQILANGNSSSEVPNGHKCWAEWLGCLHRLNTVTYGARSEFLPPGQGQGMAIKIVLGTMEVHYVLSGYLGSYMVSAK